MTSTDVALLQGKLSPQLLMTFLTVVGGRAMQVYTSANYARARVSDASHSLFTFLFQTSS